jgi:hypothetical protein
MAEYSALNLVGNLARCPWCNETVKVVKDSSGMNAVLSSHGRRNNLLCPMSLAILKVTIEEAMPERVLIGMTKEPTSER